MRGSKIYMVHGRTSVKFSYQHVLLYRRLSHMIEICQVQLMIRNETQFSDFLIKIFYCKCSSLLAEKSESNE